MSPNEIYTDIAKNLSDDELETLARFREASKTNTWLPMESLYMLPSGFLGAKLDDECNLVAQLSPFGMLVARAALALEAEAAA